MSDKRSAYAIGAMQRSILIGAAIGLYYGIFFAIMKVSEKQNLPLKIMKYYYHSDCRPMSV